MPSNPGKMTAELFDQAMQTFEAAVKSGVKLQEDIAHWWADALGDSGSPQAWQRRMQSIAAEMIPTAQRSAADCMQAFDQGCKNSMELLRKAFETGQSESMAEMQSKTQELWEATLKTLRNNAETMVQANARAMAAWADLAKRNMNGKPSPSASSRPTPVAAAH